jgi:vacuolar-type H+-ATPase subunit I/STV1
MILFYYLLNILLISAIGYWLWKRETDQHIKPFFIPAFVLKLMAGILLGIFYQNYFGGGDAQLFQNQSDYVTEYAQQNTPG